MAKKEVKESLESKITRAYMDYVLNNGAPPKSVFVFCKDLKIQEDKFYSKFGSFEAIDSVIFRSFFTHTLEVLHKSKEYKAFDSQNKLLSFYYTFFEVLKANRSYVTSVLENKKDILKSIGVLAELRAEFREYLTTLELAKIDFKVKQLEEIQEKGTKEFFWTQMLVILKFWLDDSSASFEKTDVFIEKSIQTSFDLMNTAPIKSVLDLARFLYKEKINPVV